MTYRFAAEASDMVTAIVPVGGAMAVDRPVLSASVPLLHIHSVDDPRALYEGGEGPPFPGTQRTTIGEPVVSGIETWASINDCGPALSATDAITGRGENSGQQVERLIWDCPEGTAVEHLRLMGSGHGWPGVTVGPVWQRLLGPPTTLVDASEEAWLFASRFSR